MGTFESARRGARVVAILCAGGCTTVPNAPDDGATSTSTTDATSTSHGSSASTGEGGGGSTTANTGSSSTSTSSSGTGGAAPAQWVTQFGTREWEFGLGVAVGGDGAVLVSGSTAGALSGANQGSDDAFVMKLNPSGVPVWTRQFGTSGGDVAVGVGTDASGNVYVAGGTSGVLGAAQIGSGDAFVRKLDASGAIVWTEQFGAAGAGTWAVALRLDTAGNAFVAGTTNGDLGGTSAGAVDGFLSKVTANGAIAWTRQFGTTGADFAYALATDAAGNAIVVGDTPGAFPNAAYTDIFVRKFDTTGALLWARVIGSAPEDRGAFVATDDVGDIFVAGFTEGDLAGTGNAGKTDAFVRKFNGGGDVQWTRQFGTSGDDAANVVVSDGPGTKITVAGTFAVGGSYVAELSGEGDVGAPHFFAASQNGINGVALDGAGNVFLAGTTEDDLAGTGAQGATDAFVMKNP